MNASIGVRRATTADIATLARTLSSAFRDDPVTNWLLPPGLPGRDRRLHQMWARTVRAYLRNAKPAYLTADGRGAALWAPPGTWLPRNADLVRDLLPMLAIFRGSLPRASRMQTQIVAAHPRHPKHWYLFAIGTHLDAQGQGLGTALLREVLDRIDLAGEPAYLESSNVRNVPLYERHGFTVVEEMTIDGGGPTMWRMWRDPQ
ncbi:MAG TPA: GNAT family N-acetyltransferase [Mycobacteriales bacterium]|nr:GNAT family N-acetyltransferase [Mycobacteriales bacterium]